MSSHFFAGFLLTGLLYNFPKLIFFCVGCQNQWDGALAALSNQESRWNLLCALNPWRETPLCQMPICLDRQDSRVLFDGPKEKSLGELSIWNTAHFIFLKGLGLCLIFNNLKCSVHFNHDVKKFPSITHNHWQAYPFLEGKRDKWTMHGEKYGMKVQTQGAQKTLNTDSIYFLG